MRFLGTLLIAALVLMVCELAVAQSTGLAGSEWRPITILDDAFPDDFEAFIQFRGEGQLTGSSGCNRLTGRYQIDGDRLTIGPLASTRMACPEPLMEAEQRVHAALGQIASFKRDRVDLSLFDADGNTIVTLTQTDAD